MSKILELYEKRNRAAAAARSFLDSRRSDDNGTLSAEDESVYAKMEADIMSLGREIERENKLNALDAELSKPTSEPIVNTPRKTENTKSGRASDEYRQSFWNAMRQRDAAPNVLNALQIGSDSEGGYLVPDEFECTLVKALEDENILRTLAHVITSSSGDKKIPVVASNGEASWVDEGAAIPESNDTFGQVNLGAHKLATLLKISEELLNDSAFNLEQYAAKEFGRRIGRGEEEAFISGNGTGRPTGFLNTAQVGITAASATAITFDEVIDLYHSLREPYRRNAVFIVNDQTVKAIRKLKDSSGQYLWMPSMIAGTPDTILGRPVKTSNFMPTIAAGKKAIAFGDFSYFWIADRQGRAFKRLNELYAANGQVGFLGSQRVDAKLVLAEAVKTLAMKAT